MLPSLRGRLLLWLLLPLAVFVFVTSRMSWDAARKTADLLQDNALLSSARTIIEDVDWDNSALTAVIPPAALEIFESPYQDQVYYKVVVDGAHLISGNPELQGPRGSARHPVFYDATLGGNPIRAVAYERELYDSGKAARVLVIVGKTQASRQAMIESLWRPQLVRQGLMLALVLVLVPIGLTIELRPLIKLKDDVADREPTQLEPVKVDRLPAELRPIVDAINQCIARLKLHTTTQRQFIADAAHQLRTPLTLLDTQVQCASVCEPGDRTISEALTGIRRTSRKMVDMTNQLLLLAQAESMPPRLRQARVDLGEVVASVLAEMIVAAQRRRIDLGAELEDHVLVTGNASLLEAMVVNLVDNAIRYTHEEGRVTVVCRREGQEVALMVLDNGPGIPAEARAHVFERFYRVAGDAEGSGLGLAIVQQIAQSHCGYAEISPGARRVGLTVTVRLPAWREEDMR